jgi:hypothetical protein
MQLWSVILRARVDQELLHKRVVRTTLTSIVRMILLTDVNRETNAALGAIFAIIQIQ